DPSNAGGTENGTSWATAYGSLNSAEAAENVDLSGSGGLGIYTFHCKDGDESSPDTVDITISGWGTTSAVNYVEILGGYASGETGTPGTPEGFSGYSSDHYRIELTGGVNQVALEIETDFTVIEKIQIKLIGGITFNAMGIRFETGSNDGLTINKCILWGTETGTAGDYNAIKSLYTVKVTNTLIFGNWDTCVLVESFNGGSSTLTNCTIDGGVTDNVYAGNNHGLVCLNCASFNSGDDWNDNTSGTFTLTTCADDDGDSTQTLNSTDNYAAEFTDQPNGDYSIAGAGSVLDENGTDAGAPSDDIKDVSRTSPYDIGAFEYEAAAGGRIMSSLVGAGGLAGLGGIAGQGGGLAG
ncbi:unnamed protein product, partial [marine sediment metagenome]